MFNTIFHTVNGLLLTVAAEGEGVRIVILVGCTVRDGTHLLYHSSDEKSVMRSRKRGKKGSQ